MLFLLLFIYINYVKFSGYHHVERFVKQSLTNYILIEFCVFFFLGKCVIFNIDTKTKKKHYETATLSSGEILFVVRALMALLRVLLL